MGEHTDSCFLVNFKSARNLKLGKLACNYRLCLSEKIQCCASCIWLTSSTLNQSSHRSLTSSLCGSGPQEAEKKFPLKGVLLHSVLHLSPQSSSCLSTHSGALALRRKQADQGKAALMFWRSLYAKGVFSISKSSSPAAFLQPALTLAYWHYLLIKKCFFSSQWAFAFFFSDTWITISKWELW